METLKYIVSYGGDGKPNNNYLRRIGELANELGEKYASVEGSQLHITFDYAKVLDNQQDEITLYYILISDFAHVPVKVAVLTEKGLLARPNQLVDDSDTLKVKCEWYIETDTHCYYFDTLEKANEFDGQASAGFKWKFVKVIDREISYDTTITPDKQVNFYIMLKPMGAALETTAENLNATLAKLAKLQEAYDQISKDYD